MNILHLREVAKYTPSDHQTDHNPNYCNANGDGIENPPGNETPINVEQNGAPGRVNCDEHNLVSDGRVNCGEPNLVSDVENNTQFAQQHQRDTCSISGELQPSGSLNNACSSSLQHVPAATVNVITMQLLVSIIHNHHLVMS